MADRLLVIEDGRVVQQGTPAQVVARQPATQYVARLVGLNLYAGTLDPTTGTVALDDGGSLVTTVAADRTPQDGDTRVLVALRPSAIAVHTTRPGPRQPAQRVARDGGRPRAARRPRPPPGPRRADGPRRRHARRRGRSRPASGAPVWLSAKATETVAYSRAAVGA